MCSGDSQSEVVRFLSKGESYGLPHESVHRIQTHGAFVFLVGSHVYKIKRSVKYSYMDFSTLDLRERACRRELAINQPQAPEIYHDVVAITRDLHGCLSLGGQGQVVEWAVHMNRFPSDALLLNYAQDNRLTEAMAQSVGSAVARYHRDLRPVQRPGAAKRLIDVVKGQQGFLRQLTCTHPELADRCGKLIGLLDEQILRYQGLLENRGKQGFVVRGHGDLHLGNIAVIDDRPILFDALEFDEALATVDTLYDLSFLLMDLDHTGRRESANIILNRYLVETGIQENYAALSLLPLFLGLRASVRCMVSFQRSQIQADSARHESFSQAISYLSYAVSALTPSQACLIAIGGLSGTGKSTQARALAPRVGPTPGAVHIRSDQERKNLAKVSETQRLPSTAYTEATSQQVYAAIIDKAELVLRAGYSAVLDATFLDVSTRMQAEELACRCSVPFYGYWLTASDGALRARVAARYGDASDATVEVVNAQLSKDAGPISWHRVDASECATKTRSKLLTSFAEHQES